METLFAQLFSRHNIRNLRSSMPDKQINSLAAPLFKWYVTLIGVEVGPLEHPPLNCPSHLACITRVIYYYQYYYYLLLVTLFVLFIYY